MNSIGKLLIVFLLLGLLLGASAYIILYTDDDTRSKDTEPPQIIEMTGNLTVASGQDAIITVVFIDNVNVTEAILYYKAAGSTNWMQTSILTGNATISIPASASSDYHYYVTVDDAAGNGPVGRPSIDGSSYYIITVTGGDGEMLVHTVFIEEATAKWCNNCPNVANILHDLYESKNYNFYYVSLINASSTKADERLKKDYNIFGYPTVFIDGGYRVIVGGNNPASTYAAAIQAAQMRTVPKIKISVNSEYQNTTQQVTVHTVVENKGNESYSGHLKLYLTEIVSHLTGYDSKPYSYGFLDYVMIKDVSIQGKAMQTFSETKDISMYDHENLMIIAVVFSSQKQTGYANPNNNENPFDAFYADATNATRVVEGGNLPPRVQITSPEKGFGYLNGNKIFSRLQERRIIGSLLNKLWHDTAKLFGSKVFLVNATDDSAIEKIEFYIDGTLHYTDTEPPYEWTFKKISPIRSLISKEHTLKVIAYDDQGKTSTVELVFKARI